MKRLYFTILLLSVFSLTAHQGFSQADLLGKPAGTGAGSGSADTKAYAAPEMIKVEGGTFRMGELGDSGEENKPAVTEMMLSSFYISKSAVTVAQYKVFCEEAGVNMPEAPSWGWTYTAPVVNVSWNDAKAYSEWLSRKTGKKYRLPTETEWEYAARGGKQNSTYQYSGSENLDKVGWYVENTEKASTMPVMLKAPNALGIYDMSGNVWEWCWDWYSNGYYDGQPKSNSKGPASGHTKVLRGGSWDDTKEYCRIAKRLSLGPETQWTTVGFRVVLQE